MKMIALAAALLVLATPALAAEPETYAFQYTQGDTLCRVDYPRADGLTLAYMLANNGMLATGVIKDRWDIVDGQDLNASNHTLSLTYDGVGTTTTSTAAFVNDQKQGVFGMWILGDGPGSVTEARDMLSRGQVVTVVFDGKTIGTFDMHQKAFAANLLKTCAAQMTKPAT